MASFGFGSEKIRGFCNVGVYGGYWLNASRKGEDYNSFSQTYFTFSESMDFDKDQDQRWDCGFVGGLGLEYRFCNRWGAQVEARYYHSTTSFRKEMPHFNDKRYHSTYREKVWFLCIAIGVYPLFKKYLGAKHFRPFPEWQAF